jgi:PKD repeat protein
MVCPNQYGIHFRWLLLSVVLSYASFAYSAPARPAADSIPNADFGLEITFGCGPFLVQFINFSSPDATSFLWRIEGANVSLTSEPDPVVQFFEAGVYEIQLIASNALGSDTLTKQVSINGKPLANFVLSVESGSRQLHTTNLSNSAFSFQWDFGDGNSSTQISPSHDYAADGTYLVTMVAFNNCGQDTIQQAITIMTPPSAGFAVDTTSGCTPFTPQVVNTASANTETWAWSAQGAIPDTSSLAAPSFTYTTPGVYQMIQTVSNAVGSRSDTLVIVVEGAPVASFDFEADAASVAFDEASANADSWEWYFGEGGTSPSPNPTYVYDTAGTFEVLLVVENTCGQDSAWQLVKIDGQPPIPVITNEYTVGCSPLGVDFACSSQTDSIHEWEWYFPGGTPSVSSAQSPSVTYTQAGLYPVRLVAKNPFGEGQDSILAAVHVLSTPIASFVAAANGAEVAFQNLSTGGNLSAYWEFGDDTNSNSPNPTHTYESSGEYMVSLNMSNICGEDEYKQPVSILPNAQREAEWLQSLSIYPNPVQSYCQVEVQAKPAETVQLFLLNAEGKHLIHQQRSFRTGHLQTQLTLEGLPSGWYVLAIELEGQRVHRRVLRR